MLSSASLSHTSFYACYSYLDAAGLPSILAATGIYNVISGCGYI